MQRLKAIMLLMLLGAAVPPLLPAQTTETHTFTTNRVVPDGNAAGLSDVRQVNSAIGAIASVKVRLKLAGEFNGDLYAALRHSSGFAVLLNRPGKTAARAYGHSDSGFDVTFQTGAANGDVHLYQNIVTPPEGSPLTGAWEPDGRNVDPADVTDASARSASLINFNGLSAAGEWTLYLADMDSGGTNMLVEWSLELAGAAYPALAWTNPADITYGAALSEAQLNATATCHSTNVPGTFTYTPAAGTVLSAGLAQTLSVTFTPADSTCFLPIGTNVTLNVLPAPLTITANSTNKIYGAVLPAFTASYRGFVNGDSTASLTTPAMLDTTALVSSPVGTYPITAHGAAAANYSISYVSGALTINKAPTAISVAASPNPSGVGAAVVFTAIVTAASTTPDGAVIFDDGSAVVGTDNLSGGQATASSTTLAAGNHLISARYAGNANFSGSTNTISQTVTLSDSTRPTVTITGPKEGSETDANTITVFGAAADNVAVARVLVRVNEGPWQLATITNSSPKTALWAQTITLDTAGTNTLWVKAVDVAGNETTPAASRACFFRVPSPLTIITNGTGTVTPGLGGSHLYVNRAYTITASAGPGNLFTNWMSVVAGTTNPVSVLPTYTFVMQTNLVITVSFITNRFMGAAGIYNGLFGDTNGAAHVSAGFFTLKTTSRQTFSGKLYVDGQAVGYAGLFDQSGCGTLQQLVLRNGKRPLWMMVRLALDGSDRVTGVVGEVAPGGWVAEMLGDKDVYTNAQVATKWAGQYTMVLAGGANGATKPAGDGYGLITVRTNGQVVCVGGLGDGHKLATVATAVSKNGDWPLYAKGYTTGYRYTNSLGVAVNSTISKGSVMGWLKFTNGAHQDLSDASLIWIKTGWTNAVYPGGFTNEVGVLGSAYTPAALGIRALDITNGVVTIQDGNLAVPLASCGALGTNNTFVFNPPNLITQKLSLTAKTGLMKGSFHHPDNVSGTKPTLIYGVVLQDENVARGYFIGTNQSGSVRLQGN